MYRRVVKVDDKLYEKLKNLSKSKGFKSINQFLNWLLDDDVLEFIIDAREDVVVERRVVVDSKLRNNEEVIEKLVNIPEFKVVITHRKPSLT
jgi:hypothetical protein